MAITQVASKPTAPAKAVWYTQETTSILDHLSVAIDAGLTDQDIKERLNQYGTNELIERGLKSHWVILRELFDGQPGYSASEGQ